MAHFYGSMKGGRGEVTRTGTKSSGVHAHVCGWDVGVHTAMLHNSNEEDVVGIQITSGSNGSDKSRTLFLSPLNCQRLVEGTHRLAVVPVPGSEF